MSTPAHWNFQAVSNMLKNIPFSDPHWTAYYKFIFTYLESEKVMFLIRHTPLVFTFILILFSVHVSYMFTNIIKDCYKKEL